MVRPPGQAVAASLASSDARMAWTGMRPLATSWPPDRRSATARGAAQRFSHTRTMADAPGCSAAPASLRSCCVEQPRGRAVERGEAGAGRAEVGELHRRDRPVRRLREERDVEHADDAAVDEVEDHLGGLARDAAALHSKTT